MTSVSSWLSIEEGSDHVDVVEAQLPYEPIRVIGKGACSVVEAVKDRSTGRVYARKIFFLNGDRFQKKRKAEVFKNELEIIRSLSQHRHVVRVYATYISPKQCALILLPVADGGDLESFLEDFMTYQSDPFQYGSKIESMARILERAFGCLADGLSFMSERRVRHKDLKPQNILVHDGQIIYTDFGLAYDSSLFPSSETVGPTLSTPRYAAPEVSGAGTKDSSSDVFSLGCVFIEMLEGLGVSLDYDGRESYATVMNIIHEQFDLVQVPARLDFLIEIVKDMTSNISNVRRTAKQISQIIGARPGFCCYKCRSIINTDITETRQQIGVLKGGDGSIADLSQLPYRLVKVLGYGVHSVVEEVQDTSSGRIYARKVIMIPRALRRKQEIHKLVDNLISTLKSLIGHRHIIKLITKYTDDRTFSLILQPVASDGDLAQYLSTYRQLGEMLSGDALITAKDTMKRTIARAFGCLACGLEYIHSHRIRHRDVKPAKILVHDGKIIYTGFGIALDWSDLSCSTEDEPAPYTRKYAAPEVVNMTPNNSSSDVFSLGCVFLELTAALVDSFNLEEGIVFAQNINTIMKDLDRASLPQEYQMLRPLLGSMTHHKKSMRPSAAEVASTLTEHPKLCCEECYNEDA